MGFSKYANTSKDETEQVKSELVFVSQESIYDTELIKLDVGHYEKEGKATGSDKVYVRTFYQDKKSDIIKPSKAIGIDFATFEQMYGNIKKFMEEE